MFKLKRNIFQIDKSSEEIPLINNIIEGFSNGETGQQGYEQEEAFIDSDTSSADSH